MSELLSETLNGLKFTLYIFSHPFDGFWVMKSERKGNVKSATLIFLILVLTTAYRILGSGRLFTSNTFASFSVWILMIAVILLVALYCVANWAITTLLDGKGSISEIYMYLMYALSPIALINIPVTLLTHIIVAEEAAFYTLINIVCIVWVIFLVLVGNLSIHDYTMFKSICTVVLTIAAMVGIFVLTVLFFNLAQQVWVWVSSIVKEIAFRI
ncbi:MAG: YIP1 family protein [Acutalibacteraceae bacterium]